MDSSIDQPVPTQRESAIPKHLQCPRKLQRRIADDYVPPFPLFVGRGPEDLKQVVMCYLGVQYKGEEHRAEALAAMREIVGHFSLKDGPVEHDLTYHEDNSGYGNFITVGYWGDPKTYERWRNQSAVANWWASEQRLGGNLGFFREIVCPRVEQFETLYAFTDDFPGAGKLMPELSGEIEEHGYWGAMRDRTPISQTSRMSASGRLEAESDPARRGRVVVRGHDNVCLIRSGQDWAQADENERNLYLEDIEPVLRAGMDFLRDNGKELGNYSNRYVQYIDLDGNLIEKTYNIGHWHAMDKLERWAESHPTHLKIFTTFFQYATQLGKLRLYHEVSVFDAKDQFYEYINCHPATGMLRDAAIPAPA